MDCKILKYNHSPKNMNYSRFQSPKISAHKHIAFFSQSLAPIAQLTALFNIFFLSIFLRAVVIQIRLLYVLIESPFSELLKKRKRKNH